MTTISYRPELENPSREAALAFTYMDSAKNAMRTLTLNPGVNRQVDDTAWSAVKENPAMQALLKIKAVEVLGSADTTAPAAGPSPELADVLGLTVVDAFKVIELSFDETFLSAWKQAEGRNTVINKLNQRLKQVRAGEG